MTDSSENTDRLLGRVLAISEQSAESLTRVHERLDDLASIPGRFDSHEELDGQRHIDNLGRFDRQDLRLGGIEGRLALIELHKAEAKGQWKGVGIGIATASALGGGGIVAAVTTFAKKWGWL